MTTYNGLHFVEESAQNKRSKWFGESKKTVSIQQFVMVFLGFKITVWKTWIQTWICFNFASAAIFSFLFYDDRVEQQPLASSQACYANVSLQSLCLEVQRFLVRPCWSFKEDQNRKAVKVFMSLLACRAWGCLKIYS